MSRSTVDVEVSVTHPNVNGGAKQRLDNLAGMEKLTVSKLDEIRTIIETTGLGKGKKQRRDQKLEDLGNITVTALADFTAATGFSTIFGTIKASGTPYTLEVVWAPGKSFSAKFLVAMLSTPTDAGEFVGASVEGESYGDWVINR